MSTTATTDQAGAPAPAEATKTFRVRWTDWTVWSLDVQAATAEAAIEQAQTAWDEQHHIENFAAHEACIFDFDSVDEVQP